MSERTITEIPATPKLVDTPSAEDQTLRVAAYCRVSTDSEEQLTSYRAQIEYYTTLINENPQWKLAGIFADDAATGALNKINSINSGILKQHDNCGILSKNY